MAAAPAMATASTEPTIFLASERAVDEVAAPPEPAEPEAPAEPEGRTDEAEPDRVAEATVECNVSS